MEHILKSKYIFINTFNVIYKYNFIKINVIINIRKH